VLFRLQHEVCRSPEQHRRFLDRLVGEVAVAIFECSKLMPAIVVYAMALGITTAAAVRPATMSSRSHCCW
jgi:hypothetical protein